MTGSARGSFEVTFEPLDPWNTDAEAALGRRGIAKVFHGDLDAHSKGEMLSAVGTLAGSAGYVAIERVSGTLDGRQGSFTLQHFGMMTRGAPELRIEVVADSGSGGLTGLSGKMAIEVTAEGAHSYRFEYTLPPDPPGPAGA